MLLLQDIIFWVLIGLFFVVVIVPICWRAYKGFSTFPLIILFLVSASVAGIGIAWKMGSIPRPWLLQAQQLTSQYVSPSLAAGMVTSSTNSDSPPSPVPAETQPAPEPAPVLQKAAVAPVAVPSRPLANPPPDAIQMYEGAGNYSSRLFSVPDNWEVDWDSPGALTISMSNSNGSPDQIITQQTGPSQGMLYQPNGGQIKLAIHGNASWVVWVIRSKQTGPASTNLTSQPAGAPQASASSPPAAVATITPANYKNAIVIVRGSNALGTGFLAKMDGQTYIITNQHVVSDNPNVNFQTNTGVPLIVKGFEGATDRDLARFLVEDNGMLPAVPLCADVAASAHNGDDAMISGNSQGGGVIVDTPGKVVGIGPVRVEVSNPIFPGNSGSPVMDSTIHQIVGVITEAEKSDTQGWLNQSSLANANSALQSVRYYSLRLDNVPAWQPMDMATFYNQTHLLKTFHQTSLDLISFIEYLESLAGSNSPSGDGISITLYQENSELVGLLQNLKDNGKKATVEADQSFVEQEFAVNLTGVAESETQTLSNPGHFYAFNQTRAKTELDLRNHIIDACKRVCDRLAQMKY